MPFVSVTVRNLSMFVGVVLYTPCEKRRVWVVEARHLGVVLLEILEGFQRSSRAEQGLLVDHRAEGAPQSGPVDLHEHGIVAEIGTDPVQLYGSVG